MGTLWVGDVSHASITGSVMISAPKTIRKTNTESVTSSTCTACTIISTITRFQRSKPVTSACAAGSIPGSATSASAAASSGVPRQAPRIRASSTSSSVRSTSSGSRTTRNAKASSTNSSTVSQSAPTLRLEPTCHTSVLMKRNVMKSSSRGSARVVIGSNVRRLPKVRDSAHITIGPACSWVRAYQSVASTSRDARVAGPRASWSANHATSPPAPVATTATTTRNGSTRLARRARRTLARRSGTK
jgi:hypothetical protein